MSSPSFVERSSFNELALIQIASACTAHQSLGILAVANQCNQELLTQPALLALLEAMEGVPSCHLHADHVMMSA